MLLPYDHLVPAAEAVMDVVVLIGPILFTALLMSA